MVGGDGENDNGAKDLCVIQDDLRSNDLDQASCVSKTRQFGYSSAILAKLNDHKPASENHSTPARTCTRSFPTSVAPASAYP